jgi:hypothetical protein
MACAALGRAVRADEHSRVVGHLPRIADRMAILLTRQTVDAFS